MKASVHVTLKNGVLDPQGKAIGHALQPAGLRRVGDVRQGKFIELELAEDRQGQGRGAVEDMCQQAARQHGDRELLDRAGRARHEGRASSSSPAPTANATSRMALDRVTGRAPLMVWHGDTDLPKADLIVVPGGFSYGDYLRCGAMAAHSPVMREVKARAEQGVPVLGICNGFQIAHRGGPAARRADAQRAPQVRLPRRASAGRDQPEPVHRRYEQGQVIRVPVAHDDGNYFADADTLKRLEDRGQVAFRYCAPDGDGAERQANPERLARNIAGVFNDTKTVLGPDAASGERRRSDARRHRRPALFEGLVEALS